MTTEFKRFINKALSGYPMIFNFFIFIKKILRRLYLSFLKIFKKVNLASNNWIVKPIISQIKIGQAKQEYFFNKKTRKPDTFVFYRILGNDLPPRHLNGQTYNNLKFILEHEPEFENCQKIWILNRILEEEELNRLKYLLDSFNQETIIIPFVFQDYEKKHFTFDGLTDPGIIFREPVTHHEEILKSRAMAYVVSEKNLYAINNNGARNTALIHGKKIAKWVMPWDGNCFLTQVAFDEMYAIIKTKPWMKYFIVPMARIEDNLDLLSADYKPKAIEEPQIIFRNDSKESFNELYPYGFMPKVELLKKLRVPGIWSGWHSEFNIGAQNYHKFSTEMYQFKIAGWVARLTSGNKLAENSVVKRTFFRDTAVVEFIKEIDLKVLSKYFSPKRNSFYKIRQLNKLVTNSKQTTAPKSGLIHLIIEKATGSLSNEPYSVVRKSTLSPGGDIHDYWHPSPYYWPNPDTETGLPYIYRDGIRIPGTIMFEKESEKYDRTSIQKLFNESTILSLAYNFSGNEVYAEKAALLIREWFLNEDTRMNPHLKYAQVQLGHSPNSIISSGIIETKDFYFFMDSIRILRQSKIWTTKDDFILKQWFYEFLTWLLTSNQGKKERQAKNNHGVCYDLQVASIAAFLGDISLLYDIAKTVQARLVDQIDLNGMQPYEITRTITFHYCTFNLQLWINMATVLENTIGYDLWGFSSNGHGSIEKALNWLLPYYKMQWPYKQISDFDKERLVPLYYLSKHKYPEIEKKFSKIFPILENSNPIYHPHDGIPVFWQVNVEQ